MKKTLSIFLVCFLLLFMTLRAQFSTGANGAIYYNQGNVGIGVTNPLSKLHIAPSGYPTLSVGTDGTNRSNTTAQIRESLAVLENDANSNCYMGAVAWDFYHSGVQSSWSGALLEHFGTALAGTQYGLPAANQGQLIFQNVSNGVIGSNTANIYIAPQNSIAVSFLTNGNVLIGKQSQSNGAYKLDVAGPVRADKVVVNTTGADFVFDPAYRVRPLSEVEGYVRENHHLPDIQSAEEMKKEGMDVGDQSTKLLQKVEELTLYLIQQNKMIEQQAQELKSQQERIDQLEKMMRH